MNFLCFRGNRLNIQTVPTDEATRKFVHEYWRYFKSKVQSSSSKYSQVSFLMRITFNVSVKFDGFSVTTRERKSLSMCQLSKIHRLESAQRAFLDHSKILVFAICESHDSCF